jgi:hypothetical protein
VIHPDRFRAASTERNMRLIPVTVMLLMCLAQGALADSESKTPKPAHFYMPEEGVIPDAETAKQVAEVIFNRFYDPASVQMEKPFSVHLQDGVWIVMGTMPKGLLGGVAEIWMNKSDGRVIHLFHGR